MGDGKSTMNYYWILYGEDNYNPKWIVTTMFPSEYIKNCNETIYYRYVNNYRDDLSEIYLIDWKKISEEEYLEFKK